MVGSQGALYVRWREPQLCESVCVLGEGWGLEEEQVDSIELLEKEIGYPSESIQ